MVLCVISMVGKVMESLIILCSGATCYKITHVEYDSRAWQKCCQELTLEWCCTYWMVTMMPITARIMTETKTVMTTNAILDRSLSFPL